MEGDLVMRQPYPGLLDTRQSEGHVKGTVVGHTQLLVSAR